MKTLKTILIVTVACCTQLNFAQEPEKKNALFLELGSNSQGGSINFERQLTQKKGLMLAVGVGFAFVEEDSTTPDYGINVPSGLSFNGELSVPISLNYLIDINKGNYIEVGMGYTWINFDKTFQKGERATHNFIAQVGVRRYYGKNDTWMWKANFTPVIGGNGDSGIEFGLSPMVGFAIGKRF